MAYFYNRFAKGVENKNSGTQMTWWKTNFNMPVPDVFDDLDDWEEDVGVLIYHGEDTNFNMSGFNQGWEAIVAVTGLHYEGNEGGGTHTIKQEWLNPSNSVMFTNQITVYLSEP